MNMRKHLAAVSILFVFILLSGLVANVSYSRTVSDGMKDFIGPVIIEFSLRGEWLAPTTPATKIPSHGTNRERYGSTRQ